MLDARRLENYPTGSQRVEARSPWVWIRHEGAWRKGAIHCWYFHSGVWMAWMQHDDPAPDSPWARWGLYQYDGTTIRRRHAPAALARIEVPPGRRDQAVALLREAGYAVAAGADRTLTIG